MLKRRALTLIELVLLVLIIGLLAGIAVPRMANVLRRHRLDLVARRVQMDIQLARTQAIRDRTSQTISFDVPGLSYTLQGQPGERVAAAPYTVTIRPDGGNNVKLISADFGGTSNLTFNQFGVPSSGGTVVLSDGTERVVLTISASTGRVSRTRQPL